MEEYWRSQETRNNFLEGTGDWPMLGSDDFSVHREVPREGVVSVRETTSVDGTAAGEEPGVGKRLDERVRSFDDAAAG